MADETGGRFSDSIVNKQTSNPAIPRGLGQVAEQANDVATGEGRFSESLLGSYVTQPEVGYVGAAKSWYAGANMEGVSNSWDTGFQAEAFKQFSEMQDQAMEERDATVFYNWFDRPDATGVSTWDDEKKGIVRGDVFNDGKKVGNIYSDFDARTANVMMAEFTLDGKTKQKIFADPDRDRWLGDEVDKVISANTELMTNSKAQKAFGENVEERQQELIEGSGDELLTGAAAVGGAALTAGTAATVAGSWTGPGALLFGLGGAIVGGGAAYLNKDQLTEQTARALEVSSLANKKYGEFQGFTTGLSEFSGVALRTINPVSNLVQGSFDAHAGEVGDGNSEFYAVDDDGKRKANKWVRGADVAGTLADSVLQFSNPVGIGLYMAGTTGHVTGSVATMASTGEKWDDRIAGFHDIEGGKQWAAAIGSVGIDVVQIGFAGAIGRAGAASRAAFATEGAVPNRLTETIRNAGEKLMPWRNSEVVSRQTINGMRFGLNAEGKAITAGTSMTIMAPSEFLRWAPTAWRARNRVALSSGSIGPDDYYRAAVEMAGGNRIGQAIVNGWAEGAEEAVQAVLEPISVDANIDPHAVFEAGLYGAASGAGMSLGAVSRPPSNDQVLKSRAFLLHEMRHGQSMTEEQWKALTPDARKRAALADDVETQRIKDALTTMAEKSQIDSARVSPIGTMARIDMRASAMARDSASANPAVDGTLVLAGFSGDKVYDGNGRMDRDLFAANHAVASMWQTLSSIVDLHAGMAVIDADLNRRLEQAQDQPEMVAQLQREIAENETVARVSKSVRAALQDIYERYRQATDTVTAEALIDDFNDLILRAHRGELTDASGAPLSDAETLRRSVEILYTRHPNIDPGSFMPLIPQVSKSLSAANANGQVQVHQSILKSLGGDHDGDTLAPMNTVTLPTEQRELLRAGAQFLPSVNEDVEIGQDADGNPIMESRAGVEVVSDPPDGEKLFIATIAGALAGKTGSVERNVAAAGLAELRTDLWNRYSPILEADALTRALTTFEREVTDGIVDARMNLITTLFNLNTAGMLDLGRRNGVAEVPWLQQQISLTWEMIQQDLAANAPELEFTPADVERDLPPEQAFLRALAVRGAATDGQTVSILLQGVNPVRESQKLHYSIYRAAVDALRGDMLPGEIQAFVELYAQLGSNMPASEMARVRGRNAIQKRVQLWMQDISNAAKEALGEDASSAMMRLANMQVRDVQVLAPGEYLMGDGNISLVQLLLKRSIEIEERSNAATIEQDDELLRKIGRLKRLANHDHTQGSRDTSAQLAFAEVFGSTQMYDLIGDASRYIGPQLTLSQVINSLANHTEETRRDQLWKWRRKAPYVMHSVKHNPPYSVAEATSAELNDYAVVIDTIAAAVQVAPRDKKARSERALAEFKAGVDQLQEMLETFRQQTGANKKTDKEILLNQMLEQNPQLAGIISKIIPDAAKLGAFAEIDGQVYAAKWVTEMLVLPPEQAAVSYLTNSWLAEWNAMGAEPGGRIYSKIKSRMLQTFYHVSQQPDGIELDRLIIAMKTATDVKALMDQINSEPMWLGDRAELLPLFDDVAEYDADPSEVWSANLPGTLQREALSNFADKTRALSVAMAKHATELATERTMIAEMRAGRTADGTRNRAKLKLAIENRVLFPDGNGPRARDRFTAKIQTGFARMHDKGKSDPDVAPFGEPLVTMDEFGVKQAIFQTADALTVFDIPDIMSNPTKLAEGPVRVNLPDGSEVFVDLSTEEGALDALENPATNELAKRVLFPTERDVNEHDTVQSYRSTTGTGLKTMLDEVDFKDLFTGVDRQLSLRQAHKYIATIEAGVRKAAIDTDEATQAEAYFPIQTMINEFAVAYTHGAFDRGANLDAVRNDLYVDVARGIQLAAALDKQGGGLLEEVVTIIKANLRGRYTRDNSGLRNVLASQTTKAIDDVLVVDAATNLFVRRSEELLAQLADPNLDAGLRVRIQTRLDTLNREVLARVDRLDLLRDSDPVQAAINMFRLTGTEVDLDRKSMIMRFLGTANRLNRFQGNYRLINKINETLAQNGFAIDDDVAITTEEWEEAGLWASTLYLAELSGRAGSTVDITPLVLGKGAAEQHRYFDPSWGSLLDGFLNKQVLKVAKEVARQAKWEPIVRPADVAGIWETSLFSEKKLGGWTELIPAKNIQAKMILASASVGLAIPVGGDLPTEAAAYVGASAYSFNEPGPEMLTNRQYGVPADGNVPWTGADFIRLNNHFAASLTLNGLDLMPEVGQAWMGEATVENSAYRVIDIARINGAIRDAIDAGTVSGPLVLEVQYFDVDSKPFAPEWANNVYFEGVGADSETALTPSLIAGTIFGVGRISKQSQQNPLDMATKGGAGYKATPIPLLSTATGYEDSTDVAEVLRSKALHMLNKEFDFGKPLPADANALYKLMKYRHLVIGEVDGVKTVWWAEQAIEWQNENEGLGISDPAFPLQRARLVPISESVSQVLLGKPGTKGFPGVDIETPFNLSDVETFPSLDNERLATLGLTRLGETTDLSEAVGLTSLLPLQDIKWSGDRYHPSITAYEQRISVFRGQQMQVRMERGEKDRPGFKIPEINARNARALEKLLGVEGLATLFARNGIPFVEARDLRELTLTEQLAKRLQALEDVNPSSVIWQHVEGVSPSPSEGILTEVVLKGGLDALKGGQRPTYEDTVIIDLDSIERAAKGDIDQAYNQALRTVKAYTKTGARIVLAHAGGGSTLRADLADHLLEGAEGYTRMGESVHFFEPQTVEGAANLTRRSLESTLTATRVFTGRSIILNAMSDRWGDASSENTTFWDLRDGQPVWQVEAMTLIPTQLANRYGEPVKGTGQLDQRSEVSDRVLDLLNSNEGRSLLRRLGGDPTGTPLYRRNANGFEEPGIRSLDDAMTRLKDVLESGHWPLEVGQELMIGDLIPTIGTDGSILFVRVGFKLPNIDQLQEQLATEFDPADPAANPGMFAIAVDELQEAWTVRPPSIIEQVDPDQMAGKSVLVKYDLSRFGKSVTEGDGWKTVRSPMPNNLAGPAEDVGSNGIRVNSFGSQKAPESKQAVEGKIDNFGWAFALSGIDFRRDMVDFMLGAKDRTTDEFARDWSAVESFLTRWSNMNLGYTAEMVAERLGDGNMMAEMAFQLNLLGEEIFGKGFVTPTTDDPFAEVTATQRLGQVMLGALLAPGVQLEHVLSTSGLVNLEDLTSGAQMRLMPPIFTDALNDFGYPQLRTMLFDRINAQFPKRSDGSRPYVLTPDFQFHIEMNNPLNGTTERVATTLQMSLEYAADENAVNYTQSKVRSTRQDFSQHVAFTGYETIGARTALERDGRETTKLFSDKGIERFSDPTGGGFWEMMRAIPEGDTSYKPWTKTMPLQRLHIMDAGKKVTSYLELIDQTEWSDNDRTAYAALQADILDELGLTWESRNEVDYLVRQFFAMPGAREENANESDMGRVAGPAALQAASLIYENVSQNLIPTSGGVVPIPHETLMRQIHEAGVWAPKTSRKRKSPLAKDWDEWVTSIFGQVEESLELFDSTFRTDNDGFAHTYKGSSIHTMEMPASMEALVDAKLMDKETNQFLTSIDPKEEALLAEPAIFDTMRATLDAITGHLPLARSESARTTPESTLAQRIEKHVQWRSKKGLQKQEKVSYRNYTERGARYLESSRDTHSFFHNMINLSVGIRLLNPALWTSAIVEVFIRNGLEGITNLAQGTSTNKVGQAVAGVAERVGMATPKFTREQMQRIERLNEAMGADNRFLATVYDQLMYQNLIEAGRGGVGTRLEKFAKFSATATSDPKFGMLAKQVAARYNEAALQYLMTTDSSIPLDVYLAQMERNPLWLRDNSEEGRVSSHTVGLNRIAQTRSMKQTVSGKLVMGGIDAMTANPKFLWNATGHLLKVPFLFTRFNANALTTMLGVGGFDQLAAMMLDGRESQFLGRVKALMRGLEYVPGQHDRIDMSDVIDSVDLIRPFTTGAITHSSLMAFGMMAGGLGLSGEDEETKRRRRLATYLGTPYYYDPRRAENDFLYADSGFLDWLPGPLESWFEVTSDGEGGARSAAQPHWIIRQFLSPVIGIERFFNTGDVRHIKWGFSDAFSMIPNSVTRLWREAEITGDALMMEAAKEHTKGTPESDGNVTQLLINTVGMYERALFENSFVNSVRNGMDKYNRNPWTLPEINKQGEIQRDPLTGAPLETTALEQFRDDETGENRVGYGARDDLDARLHAYAENSLSASLLLSLFTGQVTTDSTYFRKNMVPSQVSVTIPDKPQELAEATFLAALSGSGGLENLTMYEIETDLKAKAEAAGQWWEQPAITAQAEAIYAAQPNKNLGGGMSLLNEGSSAAFAADEAGRMSYIDADGNEQLTFRGGERVLASLAKGMIKLGDPALEGISISVPMRKEIEVKWTQELVQDGIDMGLSLKVAQSRGRRLWYGNTFEDPEATGLRAVLWDDKIPWTGKVTYNQLNTTYMMGPDGRPWATPFGRQNLLQSLGIPLPIRAVQSQTGLSRDSRGKVVDDIYGINVGLHALERVEDQEKLVVPEGTPEAFTTGKMPETGSGSGSGWKDFGSGWENWGSGYKPYKKRSYGSSGYGSSFNEYANFTRMYGLPEGESPYGNTTPFINTSNPILRRGDVRRERVWSERGRLNQWQ